MTEDFEVLGGARLLIVDDDVSNLTSLTRLFEREGVEVIGASNGPEALEILRRVRVGVCLTDLMMPKTNGIELMRAAQ
jgi:CheY-like chemotaxis protein